MNNVGLEIERKYIIKMPDIHRLAELEGFSESRITQTYLKGEPDEALRVRCRIYGGRVEYTETSKRRVDYISAVERERTLTKEEYERLLINKKPGTIPIEKTRYTFVYEAQLYEVDVYPRWQNSCIMEAELQSRHSSLTIPPFIEVLREVTGDKTYSNASMSKSFPEEI